MSRPFIALGSCPWKETPSKFGDPNYRADNHRECIAYIHAIRNYLGEEPPGAELEIKIFDGDRGSYQEVVCTFEPGNAKAEKYARHCELHVPQTWAEGSVRPPAKRQSVERSR